MHTAKELRQMVDSLNNGEPVGTWTLEVISDALKEYAALLASVEGSSDEVVRELQRVVLPSLRDYGQGYSAAVAERAAAHILALRKWKDEILVAAGAQENDDVAKWIAADKSERDALKDELASVRAHAEAMADALNDGQNFGAWQSVIDAFRAAHPKDAP